MPSLEVVPRALTRRGVGDSTMEKMCAWRCMREGLSEILPSVDKSVDYEPSGRVTSRKSSFENLAGGERIRRRQRLLEVLDRNNLFEKKNY